MLTARPTTSESPAKCACHALYAQDDHGVCERAAILVRLERPAEQWAEPQRREIVGRGVVDPDAVRAAIRVQLDDWLAYAARDANTVVSAR